MTAQWQHQYITKTGETIRSEDSPFNPQEYGLLPTGGHNTACHEGYICEFLLEGQRCVLNKLMIRLKPLLMDQVSGIKVPFDEYPKLNGIYPSSLLRNFVLYENIGLEFTFIPSPTNMTGEGLHFRYSFCNPFELDESPPFHSNKTRVYRDPRTGNQFCRFVSAVKKKSGKTPQNHISFKRNQIRVYDIIGDIHGNADALKRLLNKRGYTNDSTAAFKNRRLIFLGDFIDRGDQNKEVIEIIRKLVRMDKALAVMGNHEYNAICYHTKSSREDSDYLRRHTETNTKQHLEFLKEYKDDDERDKVIKWFQRLPLYLDFDDFRIVHACWDQQSIDFVKDKYSNYLTNDFLHKSVDPSTQEYSVIETLLKGPEAPLGPGLTFNDSDGHARIRCRSVLLQE